MIHGHAMRRRTRRISVNLIVFPLLILSGCVMTISVDGFKCGVLGQHAIEHDADGEAVRFPTRQAQQVIEAESDEATIAKDGKWRLDPDGEVLWLYDSDDGISYVEASARVASSAVVIQFADSNGNDGVANVLVDGVSYYRKSTHNKGTWYLNVCGLDRQRHTVRVETVNGSERGDIHVDFLAFH